MFTGINHHVQVLLLRRCCQEYEKNVPRSLFPRSTGEGGLALPSLQQSPVNHGATAEIQCANSLVWKVLFLGWK